MALATSYAEPQWRRLLNLVTDAFARTPAAQPSPGLSVGEGHFYSDGFRPGDLKYSYGVLADLLAQNPGWYLADGTVLLQNGLTPPDMRDRFVVGAGTLYALGATGGSSALTAHTHEFTQPSNHTVTQPDAHGITQPVVANHSTIAHSANHSGNHDMTATEVQVTHGASGEYVVLFAGSVGGGTITANQDHNSTQLDAHGDHTVTAHSLSTNVALSNNHSGTAVSAHAGGAVGAISAGAGTQLPPYAAWYPLVKKF